MLRRTMDATLLNEVANLPDVRPFLGGEPGPLDLAPVAANPDNYVLEGHRGAFVLVPLLPGTYELHTVFAPDGRGRAFFAAAQEMFRFMFTHTPALEILTKCPDDNGGARMAAATVGFRERFRREDAWSEGVGISYQVFSIDDWFVRDTQVIAEGAAFHDMIQEAKLDAGSSLPIHDQDPAHDRAVGAAVLMAKAGKLDKAVGFYNRWAIFAGYATITALGPDLMDVRDAIVEVRDGQMGVLLCRSESPWESPLQPGSAAD